MNRGSFVFFAATRYDDCLSGRTRRIADTLAAMGHDVTFLEVPSIRAAVHRRLHGRGERLAGGVRVATISPLPGFMRMADTALGKAWGALARRQVLRQAPGLAAATAIVSTPLWVPLLRCLPPGSICYDYIDHLSVHSGQRHAAVMSRWDTELLAAADAVVTVSGKLSDELAPRIGNKRIVLIPNGVEQAWFNAPADPIPRAVFKDSRNRPVAGFVGALFEWIDLDLLIATANVAPDILFVFVGPTRRGVSIDRLRALPNVRCFGAQSFEVVSRWIGAFDVCMIPFRQDPVSDCADPIKLYEYLALGKPVVGTSQFGPRGDPAPMCVASDALGFARSIRQAIHGSPDPRALRIAYALRHTWTHRAQAFAELRRELLQVDGASAGGRHPDVVCGADT